MNGFVRILALCLAIAAISPPALAITGGTPANGRDGLRRSVVRVESSFGEVCSGVLVAPNVVLTAAHCVIVPAAYSVFLLDGGYRTQGLAVATIHKHPTFVSGTTPRDQPGVDLALLRLERNVPDDMAPALIAQDIAVTPETNLYIAGYGVSAFQNKRSVRTLRVAPVVTVGIDQPPNKLIFAADRRKRGWAPGASACLGDSGGPALMQTSRGFALIGVISWAQGARGARISPCGGVTAITPLAPHRAWISRGISEFYR